MIQNGLNTPRNAALFRGATEPFRAGAGPATAPSNEGTDLINSLRSLIPGGADVIGSLIGGGQLQSGLGDLESDIQEGIGTQRRSLDRSLGFLSPFMRRGNVAGQRELDLLHGGQDPTALISNIASSFRQSPEQHALVTAGTKALQNRLEAQGINLSGAADEAITSFAQNQTANQMNNFIRNVIGARGQTISGLQGVGGEGLGAAEGGVQATQRAGENIASLLASLGQTKLAAGQQRSGETSDVLGGLGSLISNLKFT